MTANYYRIISLVTPLLRRMVTNERQRRYALETRRNLAAAKQGQNEKNQGSATPTPTADTTQPDSQAEAFSTPPALEIDPKLNQYHYSIESPGSQGQQPDVVITTPRTGVKFVFAKKAAEAEGLRYHLSIMQEGRRVMSRCTLTPNTCPTFSSLTQHINSVLDGDGRKITTIKVMSPSGLVKVEDESSWVEVVEIIKQTEWMDEEVRCVADVE